MKALVIFYSRTGTTRSMAETIAAALSREKADVELVTPEEVAVERLTQNDLIVAGSPTYYGTMAAEIKKFLDDSIRVHGKLEGVVGGAFASSANTAGGNETTVWSILSALLIHGMVIKGMSGGNHYGPVAVGTFDQTCEKECIQYAQSLAALTRKLRSS